MSKTVLFKTVQFSISTQIQCQKQFYLKQFSLAYKNSSISKNSVMQKYSFNDKKFQFSLANTQFSSI